MQKAVIGDVHSNQTNDEIEIISQLKLSTAGKSEKILSCQKAGLSGRFRKSLVCRISWPEKQTACQ